MEIVIIVELGSVLCWVGKDQEQMLYLFLDPLIGVPENSSKYDALGREKIISFLFVEIGSCSFILSIILLSLRLFFIFILFSLPTIC